MHSKADCHTHTHYSGVTKYKALRFPESVTRPAKLVDLARERGYSVLCVTDHDSIAGAFKAREYARKYDDIDVVVGEEITSADGEVLGLWLNELIPPGLSIEETIDEIRGQGGIAIAPHPYSFYVHCLGDRILDLDLDGIEVLNGGHVDRYTNPMAREVAAANPGKWAEMSSSDAHSTHTFGYNWTEFEGRGEDDLRKAILSRATVPKGKPAPVIAQVRWSMEVVMGAQRMLLRSLFGQVVENPDDPLVTKMLDINAGKKLGGLIGGCLYLVPPMPFIAAWLSTTWLKRRAQKLLDDLDRKFEEMKVGGKDRA
ncbi:MAG: PHP domain-containing protein [Thermoplasmatales archaeon]|nr:PHP domain-containing protein [Thermoplasmatales archaeon]